MGSIRPDRSARVRWVALLAAAVLVAAALAVVARPPTQASAAYSLAASRLPMAVAASASTSSAPMPQPLTAAGGGPDWINVTATGPGAAPPASWGASSAYDPADQVTVLFGGCQNVTCPSNQTWVFASGTWTNVTNPSNAPPARYAASMDYDANMGGVLLFGGFGKSGSLNDTWLYDGGHWTNLSWVSFAPAPRSGAMMAFDPEPEENGSVLFGGVLASGLTTNDTWVWQGWSGWTQLVTTLAPAPVELGGYAYSPSDGYILLFGGIEVCGIFCFGVVTQTWEFYAGEWWPTTPTGSAPTARAGAAMTYDAGIGEIVLFGGYNASFAFPTDTWTYAHGSWFSWTTSVTPSGREQAAVSADSGPLAPLLFGGAGLSANTNDTWVFEPAPAMTISVSPPTLEASAPVTVTVAVSGGSAPYRVLLDFGDTTSTLLTGPGPFDPQIHVYVHPGTVSLNATVTDALGATGSTSTPSLSVIAGPSVSLPAPSHGVDTGVPISLGAVAGPGGAPPLSFAWTFGDGATGSGANVSHAYAATGMYVVTVNATDNAGGTASASTHVLIAPIPSVSAEAAPATAAVGALVSLFGNVTGGTAPFAYAWSFGDGNTSGSPAPVHAFAKEGTYTVNVWVNDSGGGSAQARVTVNVGSTSIGASGGIPLWFWAGLAALLVVGALAVALIVMRPKRPTKPAEAPPAQPKYPEDEL